MSRPRRRWSSDDGRCFWRSNIPNTSSCCLFSPDGCHPIPSCFPSSFDQPLPPVYLFPRPGNPLLRPSGRRRHDVLTLTLRTTNNTHVYSDVFPFIHAPLWARVLSLSPSRSTSHLSLLHDPILTVFLLTPSLYSLSLVRSRLIGVSFHLGVT